MNVPKILAKKDSSSRTGKKNAFAISKQKMAMELKTKETSRSNPTNHIYHMTAP